MKLKPKSTKEIFKEAYRIARQPDLFLACDIDGAYRFVPKWSVTYLIYAIECLKARGYS